MCPILRLAVHQTVEKSLIFFEKQGPASIGTESPAIDALIVAAGKATTRDELVTALRALDRVLRARLDWIPSWYLANHRVAYWDMFGFPEQKPDFGFPVETLWWFDKGKAAKIGKA